MADDIKVRKGQSGDVPTMIDLLVALFSAEADFIADEKRQQRGLELMLADENNRCVLVAEYQGKVIGMCSAQLLISTSEGAPKALVEDVVVDEECRGRGVGKKLLVSLEEWTKTKGVKRLDLMADHHNEGGLAFYDTMKWKRTNLVGLQKST